jgi:hypothetical protein
MNERIKELAEQAHSYACKYAQQPDYNPHNPYNQGMYKQRYDSKFAELIVRECAGLFPNVYVEIETDYGHTPVIAEDYIKKHFGVEK